MAMILTMVWGALHGHLVPWCWKDSFPGPLKISMIDHSMCCYWTRPSEQQKSLDCSCLSSLLVQENIPSSCLFSYTESHHYNAVQFSSVTQSYLTLCNPMDCSMPGLSQGVWPGSPSWGVTGARKELRKSPQPEALFSLIRLNLREWKDVVWTGPLLYHQRISESRLPTQFTHHYSVFAFTLSCPLNHELVKVLFKSLFLFP